jgi:signal transduction histidine kinase
MMESEPDIPCAHVAEFVRKHIHDLRNVLNTLELETGLLRELVSGDEARVSADRVCKQVRVLADRLRSLSESFRDTEPMTAPITARELLLIWREQHATVEGAPEVQWVDNLGDEKVTVDVEMMVKIFREILSNAAAFAQGSPVVITMRSERKAVTFELREPKAEVLDPSQWGRPFSRTRQGHYGLGLWSARRMVQAHGATFEQRYLTRERQLMTRLCLPTTGA